MTTSLPLASPLLYTNKNTIVGSIFDSLPKLKPNLFLFTDLIKLSDNTDKQTTSTNQLSLLTTINTTAVSSINAISNRDLNIIVKAL